MAAPDKVTNFPQPVNDFLNSLSYTMPSELNIVLSVTAFAVSIILFILCMIYATHYQNNWVQKHGMPLLGFLCLIGGGGYLLGTLYGLL